MKWSETKMNIIRPMCFLNHFDTKNIAIVGERRL